MGYPPQGIDGDVLKRSNISDDTWEMLTIAQNPRQLRILLRRILRSEEEQGE